VEVAAAANVAVGTVSRVLNTPDEVGPDIRQRVLDAIARMNYTPLRRRRKSGLSPDGSGPRWRGNFGMLMTGMDDTLSHLPVVSEALHGVELAMASEGMNLLLANVPDADRVPAFLAKNHVDGLIVKSPLLGDLKMCASPALVAAINRVPHVWLLGKPESAEGDVCDFDFDSGVKQAVEHLHARGHRRIAFLDPRPGQARTGALKRTMALYAERRGMQLRLLEKLLNFQVKWPVSAVTQPDEVKPLLDRWASLPAASRPTAIVVSADSIAVQVYRALQQMGLVVGRDVSLVSCTHEKTLVSGLDPVLTTLDIRAEAIGRRAVEQLIWRVRNKADTFATKILVEPRFIEGGSVAAIKAT
jgi:DNA-binding LacI/PurR family transcriptional regulator